MTEFAKTYEYPARSLHSHILEWLAQSHHRDGSPSLALMTGLTLIAKFDYDELIRCPRMARAETLSSHALDDDEPPKLLDPLRPVELPLVTPRYTPAVVDLLPPRRVLVYLDENEDELLRDYTHNNCIYHKPEKNVVKLLPAVLRPIRLMPLLLVHQGVSLDQFDYGAAVEAASGAPTKQHWVPNKTAPKCMLCRQQFAQIPLLGQGCLRHHCRFCGGLFCPLCIRSDLDVVVDEHARFIFGAKPLKATKVCTQCVGVNRRLRVELADRGLTGPMYVANPFIRKPRVALVLSDLVDTATIKQAKRLSVIHDEGIVWSSF